MSTVLGIYKKLHSIMGEANYIQKDKKNPHFGYTYASEAAIKDALHVLFVKHGVLPVFCTTNQQAVEIGKTAKGNTQYRTTLTLTYRFIDIDDGSSVEGTMEGAGVDGEDKGTYKAITGALKYCLTSQFIIPTGDDPESDSGEKPTKQEKPAHKSKESTTIGAPPNAPAGHPLAPGVITEPQRKRLYAIVGKSTWSDDDVRALLKDFGVETSVDIKKTDYEKICGIIETGDYAAYLDFKTNRPA